jgi:hypothetical protein
MSCIKRLWAVGFIPKVLLLFAVQIAFLAARWYFSVSGGIEEDLELFSQWRFSIGDNPGMLSALNIVHHFIVTAILANQLHQGLGANKTELILRHGMGHSLLKEISLVILEAAAIEACMTGLAVAMSWCLRIGQYSPKWEVYLPLQLSFLGAEIIHLVAMETMLCYTSSEIANIVLTFWITMETGAAYIGIKWSPVYVSAYELGSNCGMNGSILTAVGVKVILMEVGFCFMLWLLIRIGSDIL